MRQIIVLVTGLFTALAGHAQSISEQVVRIGLVADLTGPYAELAGPGALIAAELAIADYGGGRTVELLVADSQGDGQTVTGLARRLHEEEGADVLIGNGGPQAALLLSRYGREQGVITIDTGSNEASLADENCSPWGLQWTVDTDGLGNTTSAAFAPGQRRQVFLQSTRPIRNQIWIVNDGSGDHVITGTPDQILRDSAMADLSLGEDLEVYVLANGGEELRNAVRSAYELGILRQGRPTLVMQLHLPDIRAIGLYHASGLLVGHGFYWDLNDQTRAWAQRFRERAGVMPTETQAAVYSAVGHYLQAVAAVGSDETGAVLTAMRDRPVADFYAGGGRLRQDGRLSRDLYLMEVKRASESRGYYDYFRAIKRVAAADVYPGQPRSCALTG